MSCQRSRRVLPDRGEPEEGMGTDFPLLAHEPQCCWSCTSLEELGPGLGVVTDVLACLLPVF